MLLLLSGLNACAVSYLDDSGTVTHVGFLIHRERAVDGVLVNSSSSLGLTVDMHAEGGINLGYRNTTRFSVPENTTLDFELHNGQIVRGLHAQAPAHLLTEQD